MTKIELTLAVEHGILFLHGTDEHPEVPKDAGSTQIASTESCIAEKTARANVPEILVSGGSNATHKKERLRR